MFNILKMIQKDRRGVFFTYLFAYFSFIYHFIYLFLFNKLGIVPMFYFNFFSVGVFLTLCILLSLKKNYEIPYMLGLFDVTVHQILADYYIGIDCHFHFLFIAISLVTFVTISNRRVLGSIYSTFSILLFIFLEVITDYVKPIYIIPQKAHFWIKITNTGFGGFLVLFTVFVFSYIVNHIEDNLELQVESKTKDLESRNKKVSQLQNHIIYSLANLVENRDSSTGSHVRRTREYVALIAKKAAEKGLYKYILNNSYIDIIQRAAPLHDIGKIVIPDSILKKTGRLTPEEFDLMKTHTREGERIVKEIVGISEEIAYIQVAREIALYHHEKWNGTGYPFGISGDEIPLCARIMAIADVFDALVEKRCYKEPFPLDEAFNIIKEESGKHFDPILISLFLELRPQIEKIHSKYKEM